MKKTTLLVFLCLHFICSAQVGVNTSNPNSSLEVNGSLSVNYKEIGNGSYTMSDTDFYVAYIGTETKGITLPPLVTSQNSNKTSLKGRLYTIKNLSDKEIKIFPSSSNKIRYENTEGKGEVLIPPGGIGEFIASPEKNWVATIWDTKATNIYGFRLYVPDIRSSDLDKDCNKCTIGDWTLIKKKIYNTRSNNYGNYYYFEPSGVVLYYKYNGNLKFDENNINPLFTSFNNLNGENNTTRDTFVASYFGSYKDKDGKLIMKVAVTRVDLISNRDRDRGNSDWGGEFYLTCLIFLKQF